MTTQVELTDDMLRARITQERDEAREALALAGEIERFIWNECIHVLKTEPLRKKAREFCEDLRRAASVIKRATGGE